MNSTGLVGSHAANAGETPAKPRANAVEINTPFNFIFIYTPLPKKWTQFDSSLDAQTKGSSQHSFPNKITVTNLW
jgi:hypothetical protein